MPRQNNPRVRITNDRGIVRLRFTWNGKRHSINLGMPWTKANKSYAEAVAARMELDLAANQFDETYERYLPGRQPKTSRSNYNDKYLTVPDVFRRFRQYKSSFIDETSSSIWDYAEVLRYLEEVYDGRDASSLTRSDATQLIDYVKGLSLTDQTKRQRLGKVKSAFDWAVDEGLLRQNVFTSVSNAFHVVGKKAVQVFSVEEARTIIRHFYEHPTYSYYGPIIEFLFKTGCRTGEACGLRWRSIGENFQTVTIQERLAPRGRKGSAHIRPTKTGEIRTFRVTRRVQELLSERYHEVIDTSSEGFVFTTPNGNPIDAKNLLNRAWTPILNDIDIPYRKLYATRATFITACLADGMSPYEIAKITGHNVETLYRSYVGKTADQPTLPDDLYDRCDSSPVQEHRDNEAE